MICCPNCGLQLDPKPTSLGEIPVERLVNDQVRQSQLALALVGVPTPHSINIVEKGTLQ